MFHVPDFHRNLLSPSITSKKNGFEPNESMMTKSLSCSALSSQSSDISFEGLRKLHSESDMASMDAILISESHDEHVPRKIESSEASTSTNTKQNTVDEPTTDASLDITTATEMTEEYNSENDNSVMSISQLDISTESPNASSNRTVNVSSSCLTLSIIRISLLKN